MAMAFSKAIFGAQILETISELGKIFAAAGLREFVMVSVDDSCNLVWYPTLKHQDLEISKI